MHLLIDGFIAKSNKAFKAQGYPLEFANWCAAAAAPAQAPPPGSPPPHPHPPSAPA